MIHALRASSKQHPPMQSLLLRLFDHLSRFERWFERRYGWFFTNGMKHRPHQR